MESTPEPTLSCLPSRKALWDWALKNWCFWTVVLEKRLLKVPWTARRSSLSILKEFNTEDSLEELMLKLKLPGKHLAAGKDWGQEEKWMAEDEVVGWHHQLNGHEFEQTAGDSEGKESMSYCSSWSRQIGRDWATEQQPTCFPLKCIRNY